METSNIYHWIIFSINSSCITVVFKFYYFLLFYYCKFLFFPGRLFMSARCLIGQQVINAFYHLCLIQQKHILVLWTMILKLIQILKLLVYFCPSQGNNFSLLFCRLTFQNKARLKCSSILLYRSAIHVCTLFRVCGTFSIF